MQHSFTVLFLVHPSCVRVAWLQERQAACPLLQVPFGDGAYPAFVAQRRQENVAAGQSRPILRGTWFFQVLVCSEANKTALPNLSGAIPEPTSSPCGEPPLFRRIQRGSAAPRESRPADTRHPAGHVLVAWSAPDTDLVNSTYDARSRVVNYHGGREPPLLLHPPALRPLRTAPRLHAHARTHAHTHALARAHTHTHVVA